MPLLKDILQHATAKEYRVLRGKALECATLIGSAVGKEVFFNDSKDIMDYMVSLQGKHLGLLFLLREDKMEADDPQYSFMQHAWARICGV